MAPWPPLDRAYNIFTITSTLSPVTGVLTQSLIQSLAGTVTIVVAGAWCQLEAWHTAGQPAVRVRRCHGRGVGAGSGHRLRIASCPSRPASRGPDRTSDSAGILERELADIGPGATLWIRLDSSLI